MRTLFSFLLVSAFALALIPHNACAVDDLELWRNFVQLVMNGQYTEEMISPHFESLRRPNMDFINRIRAEALRDELESKPEIIRIGEQISYLVPLTFGKSRTTYCFTFVEENGQARLRHIEAIFIRLDKIESLPTSEFPDLSDDQKIWAREEVSVSEQVNLFNFLSEDKGKEFAFNWFRDGEGYALAAKTWVPFAQPRRAFILYLCWEQAKLRGSEVTLEKLDDNEAIVRIGPQFIKLYMQTSHLKQQISFEDYVQLFMTIWQDRAEKADWGLEIIGGGWPITFHFKADSTDGGR
jgi:hypothetical protein